MIVFGALCGVFVIAWGLNSLFQTHFDLPSYCQFLMVASGFILAWHGVNSTLNSPRGISPSQPQIYNNNNTEKRM